MSILKPEIVKNILDDPYNYGKTITIKDLEKILSKLSSTYYNSEDCEIPDNIYDILRIILQKRNPDSIILKKVGAPIKHDKTKLPYYMGSLDKIKPDTKSLEKFINKYKGPYTVSDKLDGISALLVRSNNEFKLYTRGDGFNGKDISHLIKYILPKLDQSMKICNMSNFAIRGELIMSKTNFKEFQVKYPEQKIARTAVGGLVNSKKVLIDLAIITEFISYWIVHPLMKHIDQLKTLKSIGMKTVPYFLKDNITNEYLSQLLISRRKESDHDIDGEVVIDCSTIHENAVGENPEYGFAFKTILTDQFAETTVVDVIWDLSKDGYYNPTIQIDPVILKGSEISFATGVNGKFIIDNVIGPGAVIEIIKSGDVIPNVKSIISGATSGKPKLPDGPYKWSKTLIQMIATDLTDDQKNIICIKSLNHFFSKVEVKFISEGILTKLVDNGYNTVAKIIKADVKSLIKINGIGATLVNKIKNSIDLQLTKAELYKIMAGSNILGRGLGMRKLKLLTETYPNIMDTNWNKDKLIENIVKIDGYDVLSATKFADNFDKFKKFFNELEKIIKFTNLITIDSEADSDTDTDANTDNKNIFTDMKIVFTGIRDKKLESFIEKKGGKIITSISKNTSLLVYKSDKDSSKYIKAIELKIPTLTYEEFKKKYIDK